MDPSYSEACRDGFYGGDREDGRHNPTQSQQQQQQQQQHGQHMPPYPHQLPYHSALLSPLSQQAYVLEHAEQSRGRSDYESGQATMLRPLYAGSTPMLHCPNVLVQPTDQSSHSYSPTEAHQMQRLQTVPRRNLTPPSTSSSPPSNSARQILQQSAASSSGAKASHPGPMPVRASPIGTRAPPAGTRDPPAGTQEAPSSTREPAAPSECTDRGPDLDRPHTNSTSQPEDLSVAKSARKFTGLRLPEILSFKTSQAERKSILGVVARSEVEKGVVFGPYGGNLLDEENGATKETAWELCTGGKVYFYMDGKKKDQRNWMSFVKCASSTEEINVEAFQQYGHVYFRAAKYIEPGSELRVFYCDEYAGSIGFKTALEDLKYNKEKAKFHCESCSVELPSAKCMFRHIKFDHSSACSDELRPVIKWEPKTRGKLQEWNVPPPQGETGENSKKLPNAKATGQKFVCKVCGKNFPTEGRLEAHMRFHEVTEEHSCQVCGEKLNTAYALVRHMVQHDTSTHQCSKCDKSYKAKSCLFRHYRDVHDVQPSAGFKCQICSAVLPTKRDLSRHEKAHRESKDVRRMKVSNELWKKKKTYRMQKAREYPREDIPSSENASSEEPVEGDMHNQQPRKPFTKGKAQSDGPKDMLGKVESYYAKPRPFKCRYCPRTYTCRARAVHHEKEAHEGKGTYKCNLCPRMFMTECSFLNHYQCHEQNRMYRCSLCPRTFSSESALNNHQGEHTGLKPFKCDLCGRGFRDRKGVRDHKRRIHQTRTPRFFCSICNRGFTNKVPLQKHELRHKGIRPFVCLVCGKGFTAKYVLEVHTRSKHTDEKPFSCQICGKKFAIQQNYTSHMFKHKVQGEDIPAIVNSVPQSQTQSSDSVQQC
ncbi:uncharacterized protein [Diadema antillarum]|uniref:uncharacterized protein n=1 Tax=Diadema antillarum TaxID=105358 RepID=UPI003A876FC0